jgi:hypothetical protein
MLSTRLRWSVQATDTTLEAHDREPSTALTHGAGPLEHRSHDIKRQVDLTREFLMAPARGAVDPYSYLSQ